MMKTAIPARVRLTAPPASGIPHGGDCGRAGMTGAVGSLPCRTRCGRRDEPAHRRTTSALPGDHPRSLPPPLFPNQIPRNDKLTAYVYNAYDALSF